MCDCLARVNRTSIPLSLFIMFSAVVKSVVIHDFVQPLPRHSDMSLYYVDVLSDVVQSQTIHIHCACLRSRFIYTIMPWSFWSVGMLAQDTPAVCCHSFCVTNRARIHHLELHRKRPERPEQTERSCKQEIVNTSWEEHSLCSQLSWTHVTW